jgi:hypothetical protein
MVASLEVIIRGGRMDAAGTCVACGDAVPAGVGFAARSGDREFRSKCAECLARFEADVRSPMAPTIRLDATDPMPRTVDQLNAFQPASLVAYASMQRLLAEEQLAGRPGSPRSASSTPACASMRTS